MFKKFTVLVTLLMVFIFQAQSLVAETGGKVSVSDGVTLPSLTVNGNITIKSNITTTGAQIYNNDVTIGSSSVDSSNQNFGLTYQNFSQSEEDDVIEENDAVATIVDGEITNTNEYIQKDWKILTTNNSDITFGGKLKAALGSKENKTSLIVRTCLTGECTGGEVTFDNKVGFEFIDTDMDATESDRNNSGKYSNLIGYNRDNLYRLDVKSETININANIMTWEEQIYRSPVLVGSNDDSLVKYAISVDPAVTFLSTVSDSADQGTHSLVVRAIQLPGVAETPSVNFNLDNIGNLALFDPYALAITASNPNALNIDIGSFNINYGEFTGSIAGSAIVDGVRNPIFTVSNAPIITASSSTATDAIKSLLSAGNNGSILDFFKSLGRTEGQSRVYSKSIEVFTGADARRGMPASSSSAPAQERKPETSKQGQENSTSTNQSQDSNSSSEGEGGDDSQGAQCAEGQENSAECKNI